MTIILDNDTLVYRVHNPTTINAIAQELATTNRITAIRFIRNTLHLPLNKAIKHINHITKNDN